MNRQQGCLQVKKGNYYAVTFQGYTIDNLGDKRRSYKYVPLHIPFGNTKAEQKQNRKLAEAKLKEVVEHNAWYKDSGNANEYFHEYCYKWLAKKKKVLEESTYRGYEEYISSQVYPYFERHPVRFIDMRRSHIQDFIDYLSDYGRKDGSGGLSPKSVRLYSSIVREVLADAEKEELIKESPWKNIEFPKPEKKEVDCLNYGELVQLFDAIKEEPLYPIIFMTVYFGLRRGEVLGLRWQAVDFENKTLTINHTVVFHSSGPMIYKDSAKTESSNRTYPLSDEIIGMLVGLKEKEDANRKSYGKDYIENDYIFKEDDGSLYRPDYISHKFAKLLKQNGIRHVKFHSLRHSTASFLLNTGDFTLWDVASWLGHSDISVTCDTYGHMDLNRKKEISSRMSKNFDFER